MTKSPAMIQMLDDMSASMFGQTRTEAIAQGICVKCNTSAVLFQSAIAKKEYKISGLCEGCQSEVFEPKPQPRALTVFNEWKRWGEK